MFGVTFKGNYWNTVTTTEVEISVLAWFFSINIFRKERAWPFLWLIWQRRTESVEYLNNLSMTIVVWIKSRLVADFWRRLLCGLGKFAEALDLHTFDHSCWKQDNLHIYMKVSVGLFCGPHCGLTSHDLCSTLQRWGNLGWPRASGSIGPTVHLGRPLDGVDSALPGPGPPVTPERGHWGGGQLRCDAFPTVCSPSSPHSALWLFGEAVGVVWPAWVKIQWRGRVLRGNVDGLGHQLVAGHLLPLLHLRLKHLV